MSSGLLVSVVISLGGSLTQAPAESRPWSEFRGPDGEGRSSAKGVPVEWSEDRAVVWKTAIHGRGWSSPVIGRDRVWLTTAKEDGRELSVLAVDLATGRIAIDRRLFEVVDPPFCHPENSYASPTPVVDDGRVYVHFGSLGTVCVDTLSAAPIWVRRDLECDHFRGPGSSPIIWRDRLFLIFDGVDHRYVIALDKETGETLWRTDRDIAYGTDNPDFMKGYGTPRVIEFAGRTQLICPSEVETIVYDPADGKELWRVRHGGMNACARPIFAHGLLYIAAGDGARSLIAVRADGERDVTESHVAWSVSRGAPRRPSPLVLGDLFFMVNDDGIASCLDAKSGALHWQERLESGAFWASPVTAEGRIYFFSKEGVAVVVEASPTFRVLARNELDGGFYATPAVIEGGLVLRTTSHLYRVGTSLPKGESPKDDRGP